MTVIGPAACRDENPRGLCGKKTKKRTLSGKHAQNRDEPAPRPNNPGKVQFCPGSYG